MNESIKLKSQNKLLSLIGLLSLAGTGVSIWQTSQFYAVRGGMGAMHAICDINAAFDCTAIEMDKFAEILPGFPLSAFAIAGYLLIFILAVFGFFENFKTNIKKFLVLFTGVAVAFSAFYLFIMRHEIGKWCLFCLIVDSINVLLLAFALLLPKSDPTKSSQGPKLTQIAGAGVTALVIAFLFSKGLNPQAELKAEDINDVIVSVMNTPVTPFTIPADAPFVGKADAPITIVKFSDYQCPSCKLGALAIHPLMKRYENQVKFVFVNYPLDMACNPEVKHRMHQYACEAAAVAICATQQGKFLETYETLFDQQNEFSEGKIADILGKIPGLDIAQVKSCMTLPTTQAKIQSDVALGGQVKIEGTPTFFINGHRLDTGLPTSVWIELIERFLKK